MKNQPRHAMQIELHHHDPALSQEANAKQAVKFHKAKMVEASRDGDDDRALEHKKRAAHLRKRYLS